MVVPNPPPPPMPQGGDLPLPPGVRLADPWIRLGAYLLEGLLVVATLGIGWIIWAAASTGPVGFVAGFVAQLAIVFTLGILVFMPFWDERNQNIWDKVSSCHVVTDPNDAWNTQPAPL